MPRKTKRQRHSSKAADARWNKHHAVIIEPDVKPPPLIETEAPIDIANIYLCTDIRIGKKLEKSKKISKKTKKILIVRQI